MYVSITKNLIAGYIFGSYSNGAISNNFIPFPMNFVIYLNSRNQSIAA